MLTESTMQIRFFPLLAVVSCFLATSLRAAVVINEIHYDPYQKMERLEFIELHNTGTEAVNIGDWQLTEGVDFTFPAGSSIVGGGYLVIGENPTGLRNRYGATALGPWSGQLSNEGETIALRNASGQVVDKVDYQLGFPWPTVGDAPGFSIELINPLADNDLGGNWRSGSTNNQVSGTVLIPERSTWKYLRGTNAPSTPATEWRQVSFDDSGWDSGPAPVGYDGGGVAMGTPLTEMRYNYWSFFVRRKFQVANPGAFSSLVLDLLYDDGFRIFINGKPALSDQMAEGEVAFNDPALGPARENNNFNQFVISNPQEYLVQGENTIAVQMHNVALDSSDTFLDLRMTGSVQPTGGGPTPGRINAAFTTSFPPVVRQVDHSPNQPRAAEPVRVSIKATSADGIAGVQLEYQLLDPGSYVELGDAAYSLNWSQLAMNDSGTNGDELAGDDRWTVTMPVSVQVHRRVVRYRFVATDSQGRMTKAPYADDPSPNFAYFVYNGVPAWNGAIQPGSADQNRGRVVNYPAQEMSRLPVYHLVSKKTTVERSTWIEQYGGDAYPYWGTLVYDGKVYDHIRFRARGGVWRYAMGKNMWKFDFNRGHDFEARDNWGREYDTKWRKLNLGANIQQGDYQHRGEQGMFEGVGFRLFNLAGVESPKTHNVHFRIIDEAAEAPTDQYAGDFWGLYLGIEQEDGRFLDEHQMPDGNLYKMEGGTGELNNLGRLGPQDKSDLNSFLNTYRNTTPTIDWWRQNFDVDKYYSYQAIVQGIHHYDICYGKNYFYFRNPDTGLWSVHTWDLDLTWANNMFDAGCGGTDDFRNRVLNRAPFSTEYKNRVREIRDLLFNNDEGFRVIDEHAALLKGTNGVNILGADRSKWDFNPVMVSGYVNSSKAGQGRYYTFPLESANNPDLRGSFEAGVQIMKNYVVTRSTFLNTQSADNTIPARPTISSPSTKFPVNKVVLQSSAYTGSQPFAAMRWRVGEIRKGTVTQAGIYEIEPLWETTDLTTFSDTITVPTGVLRVGHTYRARVKMQDAAGKWSNWSAPLQFVAEESDQATLLVQSLRMTELMYNPPAGSDFEFVELKNASASETLKLAGVAFTSGIEFVFPVGAELAPGETAVVIRTTAAAFRLHYGIDASVKLFGPYSGSLNNDGEQINLKTATAGQEILSFTYNDGNTWPAAADGAGHSLIFAPMDTAPRVNGGDYPGNWRASVYLKGSPGRAEPVGAPSLLLNEVASHTDYNNPAKPEYDSNDWIEILNPTGEAIQLSDFYLSDDADQLKKWQLPAQQLGAGGLVVFDEVTGFHAPITSGFGLNKAGEKLFLSYLPGTITDRVVDAVNIPAQSSDTAYGRAENGYFDSVQATPRAANVRLKPAVAITELFHSPVAEGVTDVSWKQFVEVSNLGTGPVTLGNVNGTWRLGGDVSFAFPAGVNLAAGESVLVVNFAPTNSALLAKFKQDVGVGNGVKVFGPMTGKLSTNSDRIALEQPEAPDLPGEAVVWVPIDQVVYDSGLPWPAVSGNGASLQRREPVGTGNDPASWITAQARPGEFSQGNAGDRDGDGMPDSWEEQYSLDPGSANDAALDADGDGLTNLGEFQAGTSPRSRTSALRLQAVDEGNGLRLSFDGVAGKRYRVEKSGSLLPQDWSNLQEVTASVSGPVTVNDPVPGNARFYRVQLVP